MGLLRWARCADLVVLWAKDALMIVLCCVSVDGTVSALKGRCGTNQ